MATQRFSVGSVFVIKRADANLCIGQVIGSEIDALNSVSVVLFDHTCSAEADAMHRSLGLPHAFSSLFVTRELLRRGVWRVVGARPVEVFSVAPFEHLRATRFVGARIVGAGIVCKFVDAFFGLRPWDDWADPAYLDGLLLPGRPRPSSAKLVRTG
jgi:hypothetical protein